MKNKIIIALFLIPTIFIFSVTPVFAAEKLPDSSSNYSILDSDTYSIGPLLPYDGKSFPDDMKAFIEELYINPSDYYIYVNSGNLYINKFFDTSTIDFKYVTYNGNRFVSMVNFKGYSSISFNLSTGVSLYNLVANYPSGSGLPVPSSLYNTNFIISASFFMSRNIELNDLGSYVWAPAYENPSESPNLIFQGIDPPVSSEPEPPPPVSSEPEPPPPVSSEPEPPPPVSSESMPPSVNTDLLGFTPSVFNKSSDTLRISIGNGVNVGFIVLLSVLSIIVAIRIIRHLLE